MGKNKFFAAAFAAFVLWAIVILQTVLTRWYVSQTAFEQAFAKSDIMKASTQEAAADSDNRVMEGVVNGRLNASEQQTMADKLFRQFGGGEVMNSNSDSSSDYYVAYGYTSGFESSKKVNGRRINMMAAFSYDEKKDVTKVVFGTPLINSDF